jgi:hypothetical protein
MVFRFYWQNPSTSRRETARALKISYTNTLGAFYRLRKRNLSRLCPECFNESILNGVCVNCGFEPSAPSIPIEVSLDSQSPTNHLHAGNLLGGETDYNALGFVNHGMVLKRRIERGIEDPLVRNVKSDVENELKRAYPSESITDEAGRLVIKEVLEFRARYPGLATSKNLRRQLVENVINRLRFLHPQLRGITTLPPEVET